ncbi:YkvA family protein [Streptomyces tsukubensis]|uniref:DUF1232 domain-containing protein n=1 Tax=Streptomyces tsukubensis TaxID=83656 RepID=A0A1V4A878_9ACTN|nr:YkvA family protein [Streptomyces tsukubensis]OON78047.1 hypothetical protein B1H18_17660 [Streptomyces tsukubensis]QFR97210.1 DUF1232 domain-containing protein [Streptomyces tsukubensis]
MSDGLTVGIVVVAVLGVLLLAAAVVLAVRLVKARRSLRAAGLPEGKRWVFWGAIAYLVLPVDLIPDPVYLDDIGVLLLALRSLGSPGAGRYAADRALGGDERPVRGKDGRGVPPLGRR